MLCLIGLIPKGSALLLTAGVMALENDAQMGAQETCKKQPPLINLSSFRLVAGGSKSNCGPSSMSMVSTQGAPSLLQALAKPFRPE
jgi:hypothetical protein